jgi:hypothetical protein
MAEAALSWSVEVPAAAMAVAVTSSMRALASALA